MMMYVSYAVRTIRNERKDDIISIVKNYLDTQSSILSNAKASIICTNHIPHLLLLRPTTQSRPMRFSRFAFLVTASATTSATPRSATAFSFLASGSSQSLSHAAKNNHLSSQHGTLRMTSSSSSPADLAASLVNAPTMPLRNGMSHPAIGFGTYKVGFIPASASAVTAGTQAKDGVERTASECVRDALDCGYRFLECAEFYGNEHEVGAAIASSGIPREDLFLCSKVWTTTIEEGPEAVEARLEKTLKDLGTDYIDLYVMCYATLRCAVLGCNALYRINAKEDTWNVCWARKCPSECVQCLRNESNRIVSHMLLLHILVIDISLDLISSRLTSFVFFSFLFFCLVLYTAMQCNAIRCNAIQCDCSDFLYNVMKISHPLAGTWQARCRLQETPGTPGRRQNQGNRRQQLRLGGLSRAQGGRRDHRAPGGEPDRDQSVFVPKKHRFEI